MMTHCFPLYMSVRDGYNGYMIHSAMAFDHEQLPAGKSGMTIYG